MKLDSYSLIARAFPAILTMPPFFTLYYFLLRPLIGDFLGELFAIKIATDITLPIALFFLLMQINRIISKEVYERKIFNNGLNFPTTNFLLHFNSFHSPEYIKKIHYRIKSDFGINIPNKAAEIKDEDHSRKCIVEAISLIRSKVGKGVLVGQHNLEYGFIRNLSGGSIIAIGISVLNIIIFLWIYPHHTAFVISCVVSLAYLLVVSFSKKMIVSVGNSYAKVLIQEYMAIKASSIPDES